jgi:hypothetical protein
MLIFQAFRHASRSPRLDHDLIDGLASVVTTISIALLLTAPAASNYKQQFDRNELDTETVAEAPCIDPGVLDESNGGVECQPFAAKTSLPRREGD